MNMANYGSTKAGKMNQLTGYFYLGVALSLAVYFNIVLKFYLNSAGNIPSGIDFVLFCLKFVFLNPWGISCLASVFLCAGLWFAIVSRFDLSYIFPFMSLNFVLVTLLSIVILHEPFTWNKIIGVLFIVTGIFIVGRGA